MANKRDTFNKRLLDAIRKGGNVKSIPAKTVRKAAEAAPYESDIQQACIRWFQRNYPQLAQEGMLFHIANEGIRLGGMGARVKREGVVKEWQTYVCQFRCTATERCTLK